MIKNKLLKWMKGEIKSKDIFYYFQGHIRYILYYSKFKWIIFKYIREQIDYRISVMNSECYNTGSCIVCGCTTTQLQMANKPCKGYCYPSMMGRKQWSKFKKRNFTFQPSTKSELDNLHLWDSHLY